MIKAGDKTVHNGKVIVITAKQSGLYNTLTKLSTVDGTFSLLAKKLWDYIINDDIEGQKNIAVESVHAIRDYLQIEADIRDGSTINL